MATDVFIIATMYSFLAFSAIFIYTIVLRKKWKFTKLKRVVRKVLLAFIFLGVINIIISQIISDIIKSIFNSTNIETNGIVSLILSTIISIFLLRLTLRYNNFEETQ